jgi:hypothetical protein
MAKSVFSIDGIEYPHIRVLSLNQSFNILDGENSGRVLTGEMKRDIIGTYYNYKLKLKPENSKEGMIEYNTLWQLCSQPTESHVLTVPYDIGNSVHSTLVFDAYITSGNRDMLKFDLDGIDYWKEGEFQFVAVAPAIYYE